MPCFALVDRVSETPCFDITVAICLRRDHSRQITWCRVEAATLAVLLPADEQRAACGHCLALAAHY